MTRGFGLIEIMVGIAISSIVSLALFNTLFQIQNAESEVGEIASVGMRMSIISDRMQKDLTGIFWPNFAEKDFGAKNKKSVGRKDFSEKKLGNNFSLDKILFSENKTTSSGDYNLSKFTFITDNPLHFFGDAKPRVARVIYTLEAEKNSYFSLFRQESSEIDIKEMPDDAQKYELIGGIKSLIMTYFYQNSDSNSSNESNDLVELKELNFGVDQNINEDDKLKFNGQVPKYIKVDISLWTSSDQKDFKEFEFWFHIDSPKLENKKDQSGGDEKK